MLLLHSTIWGDVPAVLPGGNLGVVVFFVLSGYLITRLLLEEHARTDGIDLRAFYMRRAARLLPALLLLIPVYVIVFSRQLTPAALLVPALATILYLSSFVQSIWGAMGNLEFTWSLSVEEHFYALWPPLLRWLLGSSSAERHARPGWPRAWVGGWVREHPLVTAGGVALLVVVVATGLRVALGGGFRGREFAYYSTFTRMDALAVGCLAALATHRRAARLPAAAGLAALVAIVWCYANPDFTIGTVALGLYGLPLTAGAAAVLILVVVQQPGALLARLLSWRPLVHLGTISYGLYVWNLMPGQTFRVLAGRHPGALGTVACALVVLVVVEASYYGVERPLLRWARRRLSRRDRPARGRTRRRLPMRLLRPIEYPRAV